jgi:hypothetical protein
MFGIRIFIVQGGIKGFETSGQDDGAYLEFHLFIHLGVVYGAGGAKVDADFTITGKKMGALGSIYGRDVGHCLCIGDVDRLSSFQTLIVLRQYWVYLFIGDFRELDVAGGANKVAGAARYTRFREGVEGGCHLHFRTAAGKVNCPSAYPFAHANAQSAKNAIIVVQFESRFIDPVLGRQIFDEVIVGAASQQQFNDRLPVLEDFLGIGFDLHTRPNRIVASGDESGSPPIEELY